jgi:hypothetical protein
MKTITSLILIFTSLFASAKSITDSDSVAVAKVDGKIYKAVYNSNGALSIYDSNGKTVLFVKSKNLYLEGFWRVKFEDFDGDGFKDIILDYYSNVADRSDLILYDKNHKRFVLIKDFPDYPASIKLKGTNLFYSYHRSGCADYNWDSDLFKIVNFKIIRIGNISGEECVDPPRKKGIYISKVKNKKEKLIKRLPIETQFDYKDGKWDLIAWY